MDAAVDPAGAVFHDGGLAATLRDLGRFGQMLLDGGRRTASRSCRQWWIADSYAGARRHPAEVRRVRQRLLAARGVEQAEREQELNQATGQEGTERRTTTRITGTPACSMIISMLWGLAMPRPVPIGEPSGITAAQPVSSSRRASTGSSLV